MIKGRVLVLFAGALGDFICFLPALESLAERATIDVLARTEFAEIAAPYAKVGSIERPEIRALFVPGGSADENVRALFDSYEYTYSWIGSGDPSFRRELHAATRGRVRLVPLRPQALQIHQVDYFLSCVKDRPKTRMPHVMPTLDARRWAEDYWVENSLSSKLVLAIAPGSGAREKNWPVNAFASVAGWWRDRMDGKVLVILGPVEEERGGYDDLGYDALTIRGITLGRLSAILARCSLYIGNDSGVSHLAAAVGAPTATVFGPSDIVQWAPRGKHILIFSQHVECSPCNVSTMKACLHRQCLTTFSSGEIIRQLEQWPALVNLTRGGSGITVLSEISPELMGG